MKRMLAFLLAFGLLTMTGAAETASAQTAAAQGDAVKVYFDRPDGVEVSLYNKIAPGTIKGYIVNDADLVTPDPTDGHYLLSEVGAYLTIAQGDGYYTIAKPFWFSEKKKEQALKNGSELHIDADPGKVTGEGYNQADPSRHGGEQAAAPMLWTRDASLFIANEEILKAGFSTDELKSYPEGGYPTPAFSKAAEKGRHEYSSNEDMAEFIEQMNDADAKDVMQHYIAGYSGQYKFPMHLVLFSETAGITDATSLEDAAALMKADVEKNGKPIVFVSGQLHGNESSGGEGAMAFISEMTKIYGDDVLDHVNVMVIPRLNPDGAYLTHRYSTELNFDMAREHMMLQTQENVVAMNVFNMFLPHMVVDMHEMQANYLNAEGLYGTDVWVGGSNATVNGEINEWVRQMELEVVEELTAEGLDSRIYSPLTNSLVRHTHYALAGAVPMLLEVRGNGIGKDYYGRRIHSHVTGAKAVIPANAEEAAELLELVTEWRANRITKGGTYEESDTILLELSQSGNTTEEFYRPVFTFAGEEIPGYVSYTYYDTVKRERVRPTAYLIEASVAEAPGPDRISHTSILEILENHAIEYFKIPAGATVKDLRQSYAVSVSGNKITEAGLRDAADVTFENGAYFIPMDQLKQTVAAVLMEQDFTHNSEMSSKGTLYQRDYLKLDQDNNLPIYHYTVDDPRALLDQVPN